MDRKRKTKQPCQGCFLHKRHCICENLFKLETRVRIDLVVHCKELKRTSNTGRLISEVLSNQRIWIRGRQGQPLDHGSILDGTYTPLLLYPSEEAFELTPSLLKELSIAKPVQLIVPDGNWRQASKVHYRVEEFKDVQRVRLPEDLADREDLLRKETKPAGMSTLESIAYSLGFLESSEAQDHVMKAYLMKKKATLKARGEK